MKWRNVMICDNNWRTGKASRIEAYVVTQQQQ